MKILLKKSVSSIVNEIKEILYNQQMNNLVNANISDKVKIPMTEVLKKYKYNINIKI